MSITIMRRRAALSIRMNALISLKPSGSETKSSIWAIHSSLLLKPCGAEAFGAPSKKNSTGTCRIWEICCNWLAAMRVAPLSYFCTCWGGGGEAEGGTQLCLAHCKGLAAHPHPPADMLVDGFGAIFRGNCIAKRHGGPLAKAMSIKSSRRWDIRHPDSTSNFWTKEKLAALVLTGHHAQAPAVLDHSRTLPQGCGCRGTKKMPWLGGGRVGALRDIPVGLRPTLTIYTCWLTWTLHGGAALPVLRRAERPYKEK